VGVRRAVEETLSIGPVGRVLRTTGVGEAAYWRFFTGPRGGDNFQFGRYASYSEAAAAIPASTRSGWNNTNSAQHYIDSTSQPSSYAVLFWLTRLLGAGMQVIDLGGGVGQMYHALVSRAGLPDDVRWCVVEVPAAVEAGRTRALAEQSRGLTFDAQIENVPAASLLHSSGAIQFMGDPLPALFDRLAALPRWIVINKVVLTTEPTFWTLHNIGTGICTYQIFNDAEFIRHFTDRGYVVKDRWRVAEISMLIPFHPEGYVRYATGFCFERPAE
jgi:putative methyltransferase (TIGR04325 family)